MPVTASEREPSTCWVLEPRLPMDVDQSLACSNPRILAPAVELANRPLAIRRSPAVWLSVPHPMPMPMLSVISQPSVECLLRVPFVPTAAVPFALRCHCRQESCVAQHSCRVQPTQRTLGRLLRSNGIGQRE